MTPPAPRLFVTLDHLHSMPGQGARPGWCHRGAREFCQRHGLDWRAIVAAGGIDAEALLALDDALASALVAHAEKMIAGKSRKVPPRPAGG
jgi:hypothetical protein